MQVKKRHLLEPSLLQSMARCFCSADVIRAKLLILQRHSSHIPRATVVKLCKLCRVLCIPCWLQLQLEKDSNHFKVGKCMDHKSLTSIQNFLQDISLEALGTFISYLTQYPNALQHTMNTSPDISIFNILSLTNIYCYTVSIVSGTHTHTFY